MEKHLSGFSLVEVSIVFALLGCIMLLSMHFFTLSDRIIVRLEMDALYTLFTNLARRAVLAQQPQKIEFDMQHHQYRILPEDQTVELSQHVRFAVPEGLQRSGYNKPITFLGDTVVFYTDGKVKPGAVYMSDIVGKCSYGITCGVAQISYIRRYVYDGKHGWILMV